ncbi:MAG: SDR family NAD(P)-dependent oxidoreductase, partial [Verrucomicrobiota bacterium]|nr:SDR family NAD(P)-dependent oxidoreductase [Verrucomicrobiota bacterium]
MASTLKEQGYRKALVTGTSSGIGLALAEALISEGLLVVGASRRQANINSDSYTHLSIDLLKEADLKTLQSQTWADPPEI